MLYNLVTQYVRMKLTLVVVGEFRTKQHVVLIKELIGIVMVTGFLLVW